MSPFPKSPIALVLGVAAVALIVVTALWYFG